MLARFRLYRGRRLTSAEFGCADGYDEPSAKFRGLIRAKDPPQPFPATAVFSLQSEAAAALAIGGHAIVSDELAVYTSRLHGWTEFIMLDFVSVGHNRGRSINAGHEHLHFFQVRSSGHTLPIDPQLPRRLQCDAVTTVYSVDRAVGT